MYLPRHPLICFAKFALGGCLARLTLAGAWSGPLRYAATPAAAGLCAVFFATDPDDAGNWREVAVLPLFCLLIVGLAEGAIRSRACSSSASSRGGAASRTPCTCCTPP